MDRVNVFYVLSLILSAEITTGVINDCGFIITCAEVRQSSINKLFNELIVNN